MTSYDARERFRTLIRQKTALFYDENSALNIYYYRNGQIGFEHRELNGQLHGPCRTWHPNGQIKSESYYHHGRSHGTRRQWDENGRLLGSCTLNQGTGTHRNWYNDGRLNSESDMLDGKFHGRLRFWLRDGTLVQEIFLIENKDVSRAKYLRSARRNPAWPQYRGEPAGKVAKEGPALQRKNYELFVQSLVEKSNAEARKWLNEAKRPDARSLARFRTAKAAFRFVESLYAAGADAVIVVPIYAGKREQLFADSLLIKLPKKPSKRKALLKLCKTFCDNRGGAFLPEKDGGESHIFLGLE